MWRGTIALALVTGTILLAAVLVSALWIGRRGTVAFPLLRRYSLNLEAVRLPARGTPPRVWLVAHIDSKSQLVPMLVRIFGVVLCITAWVAMLTLWGADLVVPVPTALFATLALLAALGSLPLVGSFVGSRGSGALDNASGVATVLAAIDDIDPALPIGVLLTSAEELGLAGARAWLDEQSDAALAQPSAVVINCDGIDDRGQLVCMLPRTVARQLNDSLRTASLAAGVTLKIRGVLPGVLVDAIAFTQMNWPALTVSRGGWHSLARVHTHLDDLAHMDGSGVGEAARFVAQFVNVVAGEDVGREKSAGLSGS